MLLCIAYGALALLLITIVVSATSIHLERKRLLALADLTALAAADTLDADSYYSGEGRDLDTPPVVLTPSGVRATVEDRLQAAPEATRFEDLTVLTATTPDGRTAVVSLGAPARPPFLTWVLAPWSDGVALEVTARARAG
ncbi:MAG TPA: hypothetical protein VGK35_09355 [Actinotalea sp.]|jgi:hypothetical protein